MVDLDEALELWLNPGQMRINPAFPPPVEQMFTAEVAGAKLRALRIASATGVATGVILTPALWLMMPDAHGAIRVFWLGGALPAAAICHLLMWSRLKLAWQENQMAVFGTVAALCFSALMMATGVNVASCYFGGLLLLVMLEVIAGGLRSELAAMFAGCLVLIFALGVQRLPGEAGVHGAVETMFMAVCSLFAVFGAWRVETETRRNWALLLRERLKRRDLAHRNSELAELARRDPLTGLVNRRAYELCELASWRNAEQAAVPLGLVVLDIDHFKSYNDFYGHPAGDACLQLVARCLGEQLRGNGDMVARVGGEEFAILLPDLRVENAGDIAERVRQAVEALELPHLGCGVGRIVTVSCGACSLVPGPGMTVKDLFAAADAALYAAKQAGRNQVCLADRPDTVDADGPSAGTAHVPVG